PPGSRRYEWTTVELRRSSPEGPDISSFNIIVRLKSSSFNTDFVPFIMLEPRRRTCAERRRSLRAERRRSLRAERDVLYALNADVLYALNADVLYVLNADVLYVLSADVLYVLNAMFSTC
ncbi:hypothetical protein AMECASPLE_031556, partial [Ameca splendens]